MSLSLRSLSNTVSLASGWRMGLALVLVLFFSQAVQN
jgi:hypothetical protein